MPERSFAEKVLLAAAFLACPCHFPIYFALLGGTALGVYFTDHPVWVFGIMTGLFAGFLAWGMRLVRSRPAPSAGEPQEPRG